MQTFPKLGALDFKMLIHVSRLGIKGDIISHFSAGKSDNNKIHSINTLLISLYRYLVGQRLVNYERKAGRASSVPPSNPVAE